MGPAAFKNSIYYVFFPVILVLYLFIVISGYSIGLSKSLPDIDARISILLAVIVGLSLWAMAVFIARLHGYDASHTAAKFIKIGLFLPLLSASALGIINAAFFYFEGATVLRQAVERSEKRVSELQNLSNRELPAREFVTVRNNVRSLVAQLQSVIENPGTRTVPVPPRVQRILGLQTSSEPQTAVVQLCGVGSNANSTVVKIQAYLPDYAITKGSENGSLNCQNWDAVLNLDIRSSTKATPRPCLPRFPCTRNCAWLNASNCSS